MPILAKIWYVGGSTSLTIWWLCQFLVPPGNQKSRLLFDRTYHFNNTLEGEYWIKNYPATWFFAKIWYVRGCTSLTIWRLLPILSATWTPETQAVIWQNLPFQQHLGRRILDKNLTSHAILAKIWYARGCTSLTIWWLSQFLVPPRNQKSRLLFDRTYHFNNTWEGEYWIKNYPALWFWQKFGMSEGVHLWQSDDSANS